MTPPMDPRERAARAHALHHALMVRWHGGMLTLYEPYGQKRRKIGEYRTWADVERALERYDDKRLRRNDRDAT
jgi:hypothetical protein